MAQYTAVRRWRPKGAARLIQVGNPSSIGAVRDGSVPQQRRKTLWGGAGPPEAPCAAQQCGNGAPALILAHTTDFPNKYG